MRPQADVLQKSKSHVTLVLPSVRTAALKCIGWVTQREEGVTSPKDRGRRAILPTPFSERKSDRQRARRRFGMKAIRAQAQETVSIAGSAERRSDSDFRRPAARFATAGVREVACAAESAPAIFARSCTTL